MKCLNLETAELGARVCRQGYEHIQHRCTLFIRTLCGKTRDIALASSHATDSQISDSSTGSAQPYVKRLSQVLASLDA